MQAQLLVNDLKAKHPEFSDEDIQLAVYYVTSLKNSLSGYSNATGKKNGIGRFFAKVGDKVGEFLQKPNIKKLVSSAGTAIGIPPLAISAGMQKLGEKIEANSEAKLLKIGNEKEIAKVQAQQAERAAIQGTQAVNASIIEADRKAAEAAKLDAERRANEAAKLANNQSNSTGKTFERSYGSDQGTTGVKPGISITTWLIIAVIAGVAIYFVTKKN